MKKVLWLCNIVLPDFAAEFGIKKNNFGGWLTGMLRELKKQNEYEIELCFPINDVERLRDGFAAGHAYYSFHARLKEADYTAEMVTSFVEILEKSQPNIVHIWGTEYNHTMAMVEACRLCNRLDAMVIHIQGLVSVYAKHYHKGVPEKYLQMQIGDSPSIEEGRVAFEKRGYNEIKSIQQVKHVIGRTDWDRACVEAINPRVQYHFGKEILRDVVYVNSKKWNYEDCQKHSIFVSQASYPVKGFHFLLQALPQVIQQYPDTQVYVSGNNIMEQKNNPYAQYLKDLIEELQIKEYVHFIGLQSDEAMVQQYLNANVFVSPSTIENSSNSICEALTIGTPVVASFVGGTENLIQHGRNGYLYPLDEVAMLAYYVKCVFEGKLGMDILHTYNDRDEAKESLIACYEEIAKGI